eukprot:9164080-Ditylum_brightwellii.AAC.1
MKINPRSLKFANHSVRNRLPPIPSYVLEKKEKLSPSDYQIYKLWTHPKEEKLAVYLLIVKHYNMGTPEEGQDIQDLEAAYTLVKSLLRGMPYKSSGTKRQIRNKGTAWHLQNVLEL